MTKRIFLAGASGAIGRRLTPLLVAHGWTVVASTRAQDKASLLREMGAEPVVVDVFDADALRAINDRGSPRRRHPPTHRPALRAGGKRDDRGPGAERAPAG